MQRLAFAALVLFFAGGGIASSAFAAAPITHVRDIPEPPLANAHIGLVSFPSGSFGGSSYPAQRFLVTTKEVYLLPPLGSNDPTTLIHIFTPGIILDTASRVAGHIKSDGARELIMTGPPRNLIHFNLEDGTVISSLPIFGLLPGVTSLVVSPTDAGFVLKEDKIFSLDIVTGSFNQLTIAGTGDGQLMGATVLSLGPDGLVYALDLGNGRIQGFSQTGVYQRQFPLEPGVLVDTELQFAIAPDGRSYVGDGIGGGSVYAPSGTFLGSFGTPGVPIPPSGPPGKNIISVDPDGTLLMDDKAWDTIHEFVPTEVPIASTLLIVDNETIGHNIKSIQNISFNTPFCGDRSASVCVNQDIAKPGVREFLFTRENDITPYSGLVLPTGKKGDEGLFQFTNPDNQISQHNGATFTIQEFIFAQGAAANNNNLHKISGVFPLTAAEIFALEGHTVCAVVYDNDISFNIPAGFASLRGSTLGLTAFTVTAVAPNGKNLPKITIDLLPSSEVNSICEAVPSPSL